MIWKVKSKGRLLQSWLKGNLMVVSSLGDRQLGLESSPTSKNVWLYGLVMVFGWIFRPKSVRMEALATNIHLHSTIGSALWAPKSRICPKSLKVTLIWINLSFQIMQPIFPKMKINGWVRQLQGVQPRKRGQIEIKSENQMRNPKSRSHWPRRQRRQRPLREKAL